MTAEIAEIRTHVDDMLDEVKAGEPVEIVVRNAAVAEVAPMPKHWIVFEDGRVVDQTRGYERIEQLVRAGVLRGRLQPLSDDFFNLPRPAIPGLLDDLLSDRYGNDHSDE